MNYIKIAADWREQQPKSRALSGVVLIWTDYVYGWKNTLRDAKDEQPGAIAVDIKNNIYIAEGGNKQNGADSWVALANSSNNIDNNDVTR